MRLSIAPSLLEIQNLRFAYPDQPALADRWSAAIGEGVTLLYGDTGSGKSTLLRVLAGQQPASAGQLRAAGVALDAEPAAYRRQVFFCEPASEAFDALSVQACTALLGEGDAGFDNAEWQRLVEAFSLVPHLEKQMFMLSTGSRRKVGLAAALASGRPVVLLDDPVGALDARSIHGLWQAIERRVAQPGRAVVVASSERVTEVPLAACIELPLG
ncbi:ABC-type multidrug transport system ATPase subunit [Variovorax boronicumulans]|uniref:ABC-type multidrug transport system ATPase subunit n=1 Tax=Variovorax boronicumulans TaxID=436515 RepID=A0AAW8E3Z1_9BURK|nr:ATP-binding cassette domain-containing protein [Variovorax boronicumulans]MDP9881164.1 ABC-type multidrug transport system ATPase subunit [Variovorax boronicumulans]MDP9926451.1 ABC-type multidrug transport system ATPase subunit [Variovorax boronicumulans]